MAEIVEGTRSHAEKVEKLVYEQLPIITPADLKPNCGFNPSCPEEFIHHFFERYLCRVFSDPGWLTIRRYSDAFREAEACGNPRPHADLDFDHIAAVFRAGDRQEVAERILSDTFRFEKYGGDANTATDFYARTLELIGMDYPNLNFFRGGRFDPFCGFYGCDFSQGYLSDALMYASLKGGRPNKPKPVMVAITFSQAGRLFSQHHLDISTENNWYRTAIELHLDEKYRRSNSSIYRPPQSKEDEDNLDEAFRSLAIKLD